MPLPSYHDWPPVSTSSHSLHRLVAVAARHLVVLAEVFAISIVPIVHCSVAVCCVHVLGPHLDTKPIDGGVERSPTLRAGSCLARLFHGSVPQVRVVARRVGLVGLEARCDATHAWALPCPCWHSDVLAYQQVLALVDAARSSIGEPIIAVQLWASLARLDLVLDDDVGRLWA